MRDTKCQPMTVYSVGCRVCGCEETRPLVDVLTRRIVKCHGCGLIYKDPQPTAGELARAYSGVQIDLTQEERVGDRRKQHFSRILKHAGVPGRLLDVGCGCGFFLKLAQETGWEAIGVDVNPKAVAYAKERLRVNAVLRDFTDVHFPERSFDLVTLWNVLDFTADPRNVLSEVHRLLKEDGHIFIRTPNVDWQYLSYRLAKFLRPFRWEKVFDERPYSTFIFHAINFSHPTLRLLLNHSGFVTLSIRNSPPIPGDPYLGLGPTGERLIALGKRAVHGFVQTLAFLSGGRWLLGPSLEAWARRGKIPEII